LPGQQVVLRICQVRFLVAVVLLLVAASVGRAGNSVPILAPTTMPYAQGYGSAHPAVISNGGDPTGVVTHIRWRVWGKPVAVGNGFSTYVWPGTIVADNKPNSKATVIAYHLGNCKGRRAYLAVGWYYPEYGEKSPKTTGGYLNLCTAKYVGKPQTYPAPHNCGTMGTEGRFWNNVEATRMSCSAAAAAIASLGAYEQWTTGVHYKVGIWRCGTSDPIGNSRVYECSDGVRDVAFSIDI
jgi:hypothetical protein